MFKEARKRDDSDGFLLYDKKRLQSRFSCAVVGF